MMRIMMMKMIRYDNIKQNDDENNNGNAKQDKKTNKKSVDKRTNLIKDNDK